MITILRMGRFIFIIEIRGFLTSIVGGGCVHSSELAAVVENVHASNP
jgi:hypothetical protein